MRPENWHGQIVAWASPGEVAIAVGSRFTAAAARHGRAQALVCNNGRKAGSFTLPVGRKDGPARPAPGYVGAAYLRRNTPDSWVPGAIVLNTVPYFLTLSCSNSRRRSDSSLSTMIS